MNNDPYYHQCARAVYLADHECEADPLTGRLIEWEHALYYRGSKINDKFAIVPICWLVHRGGKLDKRINEWLALNRATEEDFKRYKAKEKEWRNQKRLLNKRFGVPELSTVESSF